MIRKTILAAFAVASLALSGCGGRSSSSLSSVGATGLMRVQVDWPARSRLVPQAADYVTFSVYSDAQENHLVGSFTGQRPSSNAASSTWVTSPSIFPPASYYVVAASYANSDTVHPLSSAVTQVVIAPNATSTFAVTMASAVAKFKLSGALTGTVTLAGAVTGSPSLAIPAGGWGQAQMVTLEPEDATGNALVLLDSSSNLSVTASTGMAVSSSGTINSAKTQFTFGLTPNVFNGSNNLQVTYNDGVSGSSAATVQIPFSLAPSSVDVVVTIPNTMSTLPVTSNSSQNVLVTISGTQFVEGGMLPYTPTSWTISGGSMNLYYSQVLDINLPIAVTVGVQFKDMAGNWHTFMTASNSTPRALGSNPAITLDTGIVGNLTIGTSNLGSFNSATWPSTWGVTATVGGTQAVFSPTFFGLNGSPTLTGATLTGTWPSITAATLSPPSSSTNGTVSIPITFNNGLNSNVTGTVTATILPLTGNGSGSIN